MRGAATLVVILALALAASAAIGWRGARLIEAETGNRVAAALDAGGWAWARVGADGLILTLSGEAPRAAARRAAVEAARAAAPHAAFIDRTTRAKQVETLRPPPRIEIMRGVADATVAGRAATPDEARAPAAALEDAAPSLPVADLVRTGAAPSPEEWARRWDEGAKAAGAAAADLLHGRVALSPGALTITGLARDNAAYERLNAAAARLSQAGWSVAQEAAAPPPPPTDFTLRAVKGADLAELADCAATDEAEAARIIDAARAALGAAPDGCRIGEGAPDRGWGDAAVAAIEALALLPAGEVSLVDRRARLTAAPPARQRALEAARRTLEAALPEGFQVAALARPDADGPGHDAEATYADGEPAGRVEAILTGDVLRLTGDAPSEALGAAAAATARAAFPGVRIASELGDGGFDSDGWSAALAGGLEALARLEEGRLLIDAKMLSVEGRAASADDVAAIHAAAAGAAGAGRTARTRIRISPARAAASAAVPVALCTDRLETLIEAEPIQFEPGAARIAAESADIIPRLAAGLAHCAGGVIEIGGHTDSQGSAVLNEGLSRARAEAVVDALLRAGADPRMLAAKGYGESRPIADNGTEEGRARNRRIEFRVRPPVEKKE